MVDTTKQVDLSGEDIVINSVCFSAGPGQSRTRVIDLNGQAPSSVTTTTSTYTAAQMAAGIIVNSAATAVTATLDSAANIVSYLNTNTAGAQVGDIITFELINGGSSTGAITVGAGSGGTFDTNVPAANKVVAINLARTVFVRVTNISSPAYTIYM